MLLANRRDICYWQIGGIYVIVGNGRRGICYGPIGGVYVIVGKGRGVAVYRCVRGG